MAIAERAYARVPDENEFDPDADYLDAADLDDLLAAIVGRYAALDAIERHGIAVSVLWKKKGGRSRGRPTFGKCQKASGLLAHYCRADFVIWLAADHVKAEEWTTEQVAKLLYHQARHIGWEDGEEAEDGSVEEGKPILVGPDLALFSGEIADTGAWERLRSRLASDFAQPGLGL